MCICCPSIIIPIMSSDRGANEIPMSLRALRSSFDYGIICFGRVLEAGTLFEFNATD